MTHSTVHRNPSPLELRRPNNSDLTFLIWRSQCIAKIPYVAVQIESGADPGGAPGARAPLTTKNEAPAPKFYKTEAPEWQF